MKEVELGSSVNCLITNWQGIVVAKTEYLNAETRYGVQSKTLDEKGNRKPLEWFEASELNVH